MTYKNKRALVLGGTGLIGSHVIDELLHRGATVKASVHRRTAASADARLEYEKADLTGKEDCDRLVRDVDYVFACAASTSGAAVMKANPVAHVTTNLLINAQVFEAAARNGVGRLAFVSSTTLYPPKDRPVREEEAFEGEPYDTYFAVGWMKRYCEKLLQFYHRQYGLPVAILRPTNVYGPRDKFDFETSHVLPALLRRCVEGQDPLVVWGDGSAVRDFLYATDMAKALLDAAERHANAQPLNVGLGQVVTVRESVDLIRELTDHQGRVTYDASKPTTIPYRAVDLTAIRKTLGWSPQVSLREGLRRTIDWYRSTLNAPSIPG